MEKAKRVLIVDDHPLFREGIKSILAQSVGFQVIAEAETGEDGLRKARELNPDLIVSDITLPGMNGIELARSIKRILPGTRVVIVTVHSRVNYLKEALRAGATGYVTKESAGERLIECLAKVSMGEYYIDPSLSEKVVSGLLTQEEKGAGSRDAGYDSLTAREQQILRMVAEGLRTREIAKRLDISPRTVETHRANLMGKLELRTPLDLIRYAARIGLVDM
ncbi:MAG: DNA-binding response regulator [Deltaproteobacteria bacterium HGW-Deltaproteobacteria-21]|nr:MAG: DNA-binding response regulator [Deltaproteobacteria bacterium HGW-Deltaproteobacteria-21]